MSYAEDDMLMLSGIQHFVFCPRQWAIIHIEQQWNENVLTAEGRILHKRVDDPFERQKTGDIICLRSVNIASKELGFYGVSDMVELHPTDNENNAITHPKYPGLWLPYPVEYKHGKPKSDDTDVVQLVAQVMCFEEQYGINIPQGAIYYGEIRHRQTVAINDNLRDLVRSYAKSMHEIFETGVIPVANKQSYCRSCSLLDLCVPSISSSRNIASDYIKSNLYEENA